MSQRLIRRSANQSRVAVADLLEAVLVAELLTPGRRLILVSPWISDFPVVDNRAGRFSHLDAGWGATKIRLSAVLRSLLQRGVEVSIASRSGDREDEFVDRVGTAALADGTEEFLTLQRGDNLMRERNHEKALIAETWALHGSMNFTFSGVELNGELVTFTTEPAVIGELASEFTQLFASEA